MNNKRRNRSNTARSRSPETHAEGVYSNQHFLNASAGFLGTNVQIDTTDGSRYAGVLAAFSSQLEIVLEYAHIIHAGDDPDAFEQKKNLRRLIFRPQNIVHLTIRNVDTTFATKDGAFQTDSSISKFDRNGQALGEKELQPWVADCNGDEIDLSLGTESGWDPNAMFKLNEELYGVRSSFDHSLAGYTLPLEKSETKGYKEAEARAAQIANEIEKNSKTQARLELENGDEEDRYAAVTRPSEDRNSPPRSLDKTKYIPPVRRQGNSFQGRATPRTTPFPLGRSPSTPSAEESPESTVSESNSPVAPPSNCEDNRNNNNCSPSTAVNPTNAPPPSAPHPRSSNNNNNNGGGRGKPYLMQAYTYSQPPRFPPVTHGPLVQHRPPMPPTGVTSQPPPPIQHGPPPPPPPQQIPIVYPQTLPPNHTHQSAIPPGAAMPQEAVSQQPMSVQAVNHPPNQGVAIMHGMEQGTIQQLHMPPIGVSHVHSVVPAGYVPAPRDPREHEMEMRGHRNVALRGQSPRVFQQNKRFPSPFQPPPTQRKPRSDEVSELAEFSSNLKLAEEEQEEKHESPPLEQWAKGRSPPSNSSAEDASSALKKSTLNPNAKEFVYNPSAKPFTPRPSHTPGPSRPHTPQTPAQPYGHGYSPSPMPAVIMPTTYVMQPFSHQGQPPRLQMAPRPEISSQMQVAAATGQPLLAPAPLQRFVAPYPNPPPQQYQQMLRMVPGQAPVMLHPDGAPHVQYMSPQGQPHPGGQFHQAHPQQFPTMVYSVPLTPATMMQYFQQPHPQAGQQAHVQVIMPNQ